MARRRDGDKDKKKPKQGEPEGQPQKPPAQKPPQKDEGGGTKPPAEKEKPKYPWPEKVRRRGDCPCCPPGQPAKCKIRVRWQKHFDDQYAGNPTAEEKDAYSLSAKKWKDGDTEFFIQVYAVVDITGLPADQLKNCHLVQDTFTQEKVVGKKEPTSRVTKHDYHPDGDKDNKAYRGSSFKDWPGRSSFCPAKDFQDQIEWRFWLARVYILECPDIEYYWGYQMKVDWSGDKPKIDNADDISKHRFEGPTPPANPYVS